MRLSAALIVTAVTLVLVGCSGGREGTLTGAEESPAAPPGESLEALWREGTESVGAIAGTSDHGVGRNRVSFLIADRDGDLVERPTAKVWLARTRTGKPFATATATLQRVGVPGGEEADAEHLYAMTVDAPSPGRLWYVAEPSGGRAVRALGVVEVKQDAAAPRPGDTAVDVDTPTLTSTGGDLSALTTARVPDAALYRTSVAQALAAEEPFVLVFATPQFCQTRVCGPVVDVVSAARRRLAASDVRFIHVEIYEDNLPGNGVNRWVKAWRLPTEPYTFVVDRSGTVRATFEGAFSVEELVAAARRVA